MARTEFWRLALSFPLGNAGIRSRRGCSPFGSVSNRYSHHLAALKQNRGTGAAPGSNSGALPCLFHWETQEYGPGAVALPFALCQTGTVIIWQFLLRSDVTTLRFRNSGIGREKNVLQKSVVYHWGFQGLQNPPSLCVAAVLPQMAKVRFFPDPIGRDRSNAAHARTLAMHRPPCIFA